MMDRESFELEKEAIAWLMNYDISFSFAMSVVSYAIRTQKPLSIAFIELMILDLKEKE